MIKKLIAAGCIAIAMFVPSAVAHDNLFAKWKIRQPVVQVMIESLGACSGVVVDKGLVLTAGHCVIDENEDGVNTTPHLYILRDGYVYEVQVLQVDHQKDIALLSASVECPCAPISQFRPAIDEKVFIVGYPMSGVFNNTQVVTEGYYQGKMTNGDYITTASAAPGNSGGGLFNQYGDLIGILVAGLQTGQITISVSLDEIRQILNK